MNSIAIDVDGTAKVIINGREESIEARSYAAAQNAAIDLLVAQAQQDSESLTAHTNDPEAPALSISPDGSVQPLASAQSNAPLQPDADEGTGNSPPPEAEPQPDAAPETQAEPPAPENVADSAPESDPGPALESAAEPMGNSFIAE